MAEGRALSMSGGAPSVHARQWMRSWRTTVGMRCCAGDGGRRWQTPAHFWVPPNEKQCGVPPSLLPIKVVCPVHDQLLILSVSKKHSHVIKDLITCRLTFTPALGMVDGSGEFWTWAYPCYVNVSAMYVRLVNLAVSYLVNYICSSFVSYVTSGVHWDRRYGLWLCFRVL